MPENTDQEQENQDKSQPGKTIRVTTPRKPNKDRVLDPRNATKEELENGVTGSAEDAMIVEDEKSWQELTDALSSNDLVGGTCRLSRRGPMETQYAFVAKFTTSSFDVDMVRKMYGGGDYRAKFFRSNGQIGREVAFSIDHRHKGMLDTNALPVEGKPDSATTQMLARALVEGRREDPANMQMVQAMMKQSSDNMTLIMTMMMKSSEQQMAMMSGMMGALAQAFGAKNVTPVQQGLNAQDFLALMTAMNANKPASPSLNELADTLLKMKELTGGSPQSTEEEPKTLVEKIIGALPHVANTVAALKGQPMQPVPAAKAITAGSSEETKAESAAPTDRLQMALAMIVDAARRKSDVSLYRDLLLDSLEDKQVDELHQLLTNDGWFDMLFGQLPDKDAVKPWMTELRDSIVQYLNQDDNSEQPAGNKDSSGVQPGTDTAGASKN